MVAAACFSPTLCWHAILPSLVNASVQRTDGYSSYNADRLFPMEKLKIVLKLPEAAGILPVHSGSLSKRFQKVVY